MKDGLIKVVFQLSNFSRSPFNKTLSQKNKCHFKSPSKDVNRTYKKPSYYFLSIFLHLNPIKVTGSYLYLLKTSENQSGMK